LSIYAKIISANDIKNGLMTVAAPSNPAASSIALDNDRVVHFTAVSGFYTFTTLDTKYHIGGSGSWERPGGHKTWERFFPYPQTSRILFKTLSTIYLPQETLVASASIVVCTTHPCGTIAPIASMTYEAISRAIVG
jgi:hypothetical protein